MTAPSRELLLEAAKALEESADDYALRANDDSEEYPTECEAAANWHFELAAKLREAAA